MKSWSLDRFIAEHDINYLSSIWGVSRQAIKQAVDNERSIQIILLDGVYEVRESKILKKTMKVAGVR